MARKVDLVAQEIAALRLGNDGTAAAIERLRVALGSREQRFVIAAAQLAGQSSNRALANDLVNAFDRLLAGGQSADPNCLAKEAVLAALTELGHEDAQIYLRGLKVRQFDPVFGGSEETAGGVRSISALRLSATGTDTEDLIRSLGPMLFDSSPYVRQNVVRALGGCGYWESTLLIELKVVAGDTDPRVLGECFLELLNADIDRYLPLVAAYLNDSNPEVQLQAICTLSECRSQRGVETLIASFTPLLEESVLEQSYLALGRSRHEDALNFLERQVSDGSATEQALAVRALAQRSH